MTRKAYLLVNFGGPRDLMEVEEFLISLLCDQEVIRTSLPAWAHKLFFTRVAKKRAKNLLHDYTKIGGKSPIFEDTEALAGSIGKILGAEILSFHRYLPKTHPGFIEKIENLNNISQIQVLPLFPQFSYATTGSIALWFSKFLSPETLAKLRWLKSFPGHHSYIAVMENCLREYLVNIGLKEEETTLLFSAHGLPKNFILTGDPYQNECILSFEKLRDCFPKAHSHLCYQSQFGRGEWIRPYTTDVCERISEWTEGRKNVVIVPLTFTSDHIETLYEIEKLYLESIRKAGLNAFRCPALNRREDWIQTLAELFHSTDGMSNEWLLRKSL